MASKVTFTVTMIPSQYQTFSIVVNDGTNNINITMVAVNTRTVKGQFVRNDSSISGNTSNMAYYFGLDHKDLGGVNNFSAVGGADVMVVTVANPNWQFVNATISFGTALIENDPVPEPKDFTFEMADVDCTTADYDLDISGGTSPFTISGSNTSPLNTSSRTPTITLNRGLAKTITIWDVNNEIIGSKNIVPPKVLNAADFTISLSQESGAKATVTPNVVLDASILPVTYSLDGVTYSGSTSFPGLSFNTQYTLYIKDVHGCVRTKIFITPEEITGGEEVTTNYERYFEISNAGSAIFTKLEGSPTNFSNSMSFEEKVKLPYETTVFQYVGHDFVGQFKSSYGYHKITLMENGSATYIEPVLQVQNLGLQQKVDCKLFRDVNGKLGVYFRNGANYVPNTTTVDGTSDYDAVNLPSWARNGTIAVIDGIGAVTINRVTTDTNRGLYLQMNTSYSSLTDDDGKIQANYNEQPYNTYEYLFPISSIENCARIIIEAGYLIDDEPQIEVTYGSERIQKITDKKGFLDLSWRDPENKSGMVHQTGIVNRMLLPYIKWVGNSESSSELFDADSETVSIKQEVKDVQLLIATVVGRKMQQKLHIAAGMEEFMIDGINYKKREMTSSPLKSSNWYRVEATFDFGTNQLEVNPDEIVLNPPSTPVTSSGPIAKVLPSPLAISSDAFVKNSDGGLVLISED